MIKTTDKKFNDFVNNFLEHSRNDNFPRYPEPLEQIRAMAKYLADKNYISTAVANSRIIKPAREKFGGLAMLKAENSSMDYGKFVEDVVQPIAEKKMGIDENYSFSRGTGSTSTSNT